MLRTRQSVTTLSLSDTWWCCFEKECSQSYLKQYDKTNEQKTRGLPASFQGCQTRCMFLWQPCQSVLDRLHILCCRRLTTPTVVGGEDRTWWPFNVNLKMEPQMALETTHTSVMTRPCKSFSHSKMSCFLPSVSLTLNWKAEYATRIETEQVK